MTLTPKQQAFVDNKAHGVPNREAAMAAGYAVNSADVTAAKLLARDDIRAAIKAAGKGVSASGVTIQPPTMPKDHYADPMSFLVDVMNHHQLPIAVRADAAKQLLPYQHARMGEVGKKQTAKDRAHEIAGGGKRGGKYTPKAAPRLHLVNTDKS